MTRGLLFVTPGFADGEADTACIPAQQIYLKALRAALPEVPMTVLALYYPNRAEPYDWHGLRVVPLAGRSGRLLYAKGWVALRRIGPVDLVHSFWLGPAAVLAALWARWCRVRHVATMMGQEVRERSLALHMLRPSRTDLVCLSVAQEAVMQRVSGRSATRRIAWGTAALAPVAHRDIDVVGTAWVNETKDPDRFLRVLRLVQDRRPDLKAAWIGGGPQEAQMRDRVQMHGLGNNVTVTGTLAREAALDKMARGRVLLHTSRYEGFGLVFAEAAELGLAMVSGPVGIAPETPGVRIATSDADMAEAVLAALNAPLPAPGRPWPIEATVEAYRDLYQI